MKLGVIQKGAASIAFGLASWAAMGIVQAQPLFDRVNVNLPYTVTIGDHTLQPGDYVFQQMDSISGNSRVVLIYSDNGMKFQTSAMSIPALDPNTAPDTKLVLHHLGNNYYLDKIWIQGKDYGYEFPLPDNVKSREKEMSEPVSVAARYSPSSSSATTSANSSTTNTTSNTTTDTTTANATPPPPVENPPQQVTPPPDNTMAQNTPPSQSSADRSADRSYDQSIPAPASNNNNDTTSMPHTSAGWLMMLLSGGALSGAGMRLRRKR
ncbi:MAG TPA: hypothetical protein VG456_20755 [Candidatus Sulfopaludibacter sp.]|jgi:hypothetical protein|nr:hypothetical protein [Candidatus Sulfopaludibacter sp.]